jgi:hypothetical protein
MRLSDWRRRAPYKDAISPKVIAVVETALVTLGAERDPDCWVAWGDDPAVRYMVFAPTPGGLVQLNVRVNAPGEGPRASGKVVRWARVQLGELGVEIQGGHRLVSFQVETQVLNGVDDTADRISAFALMLFAAVDGRPAPVALGAKMPGSTAAAKSRKAATTRPAVTKSPSGKARPTASTRPAAVKGSAR